jgi:hypothetical protein
MRKSVLIYYEREKKTRERRTRQITHRGVTFNAVYINVMQNAFFIFIAAGISNLMTAIRWCQSKVDVRAVSWLRRLVAGLPPRRPEFDPGSVHLGFVVDKVAL